jgi:hypothetical protein
MNKLNGIGLFLSGILLFACAGNLHAQQEQAMSLDGVIAQAAKDVETKLAAGVKIAVLNFTSPAEAFSEYVIEEFSGALVTNRKLTLIGRRSLDPIRQRMSLRLSGDVNDDSVWAIGKQVGAQAVITGSLSDLGGMYRFRIKVLNVATSRIAVQFSYNLVNDQQVAFLLGNQQKPSPVDSGQGQTAPKPPQTADTYKSGDTGSAGIENRAPVERTASVPKASSQIYKVGDTGPAGGIIFYVNPDAGEWKYLEAAPAKTEVSCPWSISQTISTKPIKDSRSIGVGKSNNEYIMQQAVLVGGGFGWAAQLCDELEVNGFNDWFMPSRDELNVMWGVLHRKGLGGFKSEWYWSSTASTDNGAQIWIINFADGAHLQNLGGYPYDNWNRQYRLRAIRQF